MTDPSAQRAEIAARWDRAATGWRRRAARVATMGMPVSAWMIDRLRLQPGQRVLELAAGPGDTGFMAAELVRPGGTLLCSDASEAMLGVARERAAELGVPNAEFARLELEWIDLETASVDGVLCRWGLMFALDREAAVREMRRVLRPGGRVALSVWADPGLNPWATVPTRALVELGHTQQPDPEAPGMFVLSEPARLRSLLEQGGFVEVEIEQVPISRTDKSVDAYIEETLDLSVPFADVMGRLSSDEREQVAGRIGELAEPYRGVDGCLAFPGCALAGGASA